MNAEPTPLQRLAAAATHRTDALALKALAERIAREKGVAVAVVPDAAGLRLGGSVTPPARNLDPLPHDYR